MFNNEFYPTPRGVIKRMILGLDLTHSVVLEPSAGKGDIVRFCKRQGAKVLACEKNKELATIVVSMADEFINYDFLEVKEEQISHVNYIIMNPPFSNADEHILHAYKIAPNGCKIIALCNEETVLNPHTLRRKELKAIIGNNNIDLLGTCFDTAERKTGVKVALIKLKKQDSVDDEFADYLFSSEEREQYNDSGILSYNLISDYVGRYIQGVREFDNVTKANKKINEVIKPIGGSMSINFDAKGVYNSNSGLRTTNIDRDIFKKKLQMGAWRKIFEEMKMESVVTSKTMATINKFIEQQQHIPFTEKNIYKMLDVIWQTREHRFNTIIEETFDWLTKHHDGNRQSVKGWKTNESYFVGKKFIAPYCGLERGWSNEPKISYGRHENFDDVCKALCFLTGKKWSEHCVSLYNFFQGEPLNGDTYRTTYKYKEWGKWYDWNFFEIKVYKKGTMHCKFKDEKVWELFNLTASKIKGWVLPEDTASKYKAKSTDIRVM